MAARDADQSAEDDPVTVIFGIEKGKGYEVMEWQN
jgi:hypothetical protein